MMVTIWRGWASVPGTTWSVRDRFDLGVTRWDWTRVQVLGGSELQARQCFTHRRRRS